MPLMSLIQEAAVLGMRAAYADTLRNILRPLHNLRVAIGKEDDPSFEKMVRDQEAARLRKWR